MNIENLHTAKSLSSVRQLISKKPLDSYTLEQIQNIKLLSIRKKDPAYPIGSATLRIQKYPGDLDLHDEFIDCCSIDEVVDKFVISLKKIVKAIKKEKLHYFSEFKAGIDLRYDIDIGVCHNGIYYPNFDLYKFPQKLLNKNESDIIFAVLAKKNNNGDDYDIINRIFKERRTLRWTEEEVLAAKKKLKGGLVMKLHDAIKMKSLVKIDMISLVNNQFIEVTDVYLLMAEEYDYSNNMVVGVPVNYDYDFTDPNETAYHLGIEIQNEIQKLYYSNMFYNPFKMSKRMWVYSRISGYADSIKKLSPLITGDISYLYQLESEITTILRMNELGKDPMKNIDKTIDILKYKLANILILDDETLIQMNSMLVKFLKKNDYKILDKLKNYMKEIINIYTINELNRIGYNPPPRQFLPKELKYAQIVRQVYETPSNHYDGGAAADSFIANLPFEAHLFGTVHKEPYQINDPSINNYSEGQVARMEYTGPGTRTDERYAKGQRGINDLDHAAMYHDFAYKSTDPLVRNEADDILAEAARQYLNKAGISTLDKTDAQIVIAAMKLIHRDI